MKIRHCRSLRCCTFVLTGCLASGCGEVEEYRREERQSAHGTVGKVEIAVELLRAGAHNPFGHGQGRGGFLEPAHDVVTIKGSIVPRSATGTVVEPSHASYEEFAEKSRLFHWTWDSRETEGALRLWEARWKNLTIEHCDFGDGRRFGIRVPTPLGVGHDWRVLVFERDLWVDTVSGTGESCTELRGKQP